MIDIARCAVELVGLHARADERHPPDWVELMPAGENVPIDGRAPWLNNDAASVIAASLAAGRDLPIDYEHQTENSSRNGQPAPAAGWIKQLVQRDGAIWGRVEWTERAANMLRSREYRFLSPVFTHTSIQRQVKQILRAALTNNPALTMTALASAQGAGMALSDTEAKICRMTGTDIASYLTERARMNGERR